MTSQSPAESSTPSQAYTDAWSSIAMMVAQEGLSWSGRERNRMFLNLGDTRFVDLSWPAGLDFIEDARSVASVDWDGDGRVDLLLKNRNAPRLRLLRNQAPEDRHWLQVRLTGGEGMNRDAIGAEVLVEAGGRTQRRPLLAGDGFLCQSSKTLFFGLGDAAAIDRLAVRWPDGRLEEFLDEGATLAADQRLHLRPSAPPAVLPAPTPVVLTEGANTRAKGGDVGRVPLVTKLPLGEMPLPAFDDPNRRVKDLGGRPLLINFWSTTCAACLEEFGDFVDEKRRLNRQGLRIVTMVTDGLDRHDRARMILDGVGLADGAGWADKRVEASLRIVVEEVLNRTVDMPLPVSLLLDSHGNLVQVHIGRLRMGALMRDLNVLRGMDPSSPDGSPMALGRRLAFRDRHFASMAEKFAAAGMPQVAEAMQALDGRFQRSAERR
ncbi:MAG: ASPIC/UnbV domain-containing protein [Planctomycetota bacterium]